MPYPDQRMINCLLYVKRRKCLQRQDQLLIPKWWPSKWIGISTHCVEDTNRLAASLTLRLQADYLTVGLVHPQTLYQELSAPQQQRGRSRQAIAGVWAGASSEGGAVEAGGAWRAALPMGT